ncbi:type II toxin-antitoxin system VapC family toxin [Mesorhizobium sp.]|uniref:type II toxin-antitoxin system VapC family toxin n=1 Tax=Mesorhizobium sp. TaxID=1871066 RepID=UPI00344E65F1
MPSLFWYEARSIVLMAERRGRIAPGEATCGDGPVAAPAARGWGAGGDGSVLALATSHALSACDAAYLSLAVERTLPLAKLDRKLAAAARAEGIEILGPLAKG